MTETQTPKQTWLCWPEGDLVRAESFDFHIQCHRRVASQAWIAYARWARTGQPVVRVIKTTCIDAVNEAMVACDRALAEKGGA